MRRVFSLPGLAVVVWVLCLAFWALLAVMTTGFAWHPHFLPAITMLVLVIGAGLALVVGASWRIVRGPDRRRALACLLIGAVPLWFLAGHFLYGLAIGTGRKLTLTPAVKLLIPLAESLMDLEARFRYPQRTYGEKVVMISAPMPEAQARAQVAAMDRHVRALEARLGRPTQGIVHWTRGPLLGMQGKAVMGICMGTTPGEAPADAEGLCANDRHEVAHCVLTSHCSAWFDPPAVLTEGWAEANMGLDALEQAGALRDALARGSGMTVRQLTSPDWYDRHQWPVYQHGAPLVDVLLRRFGPEKFLALYSTCRSSRFEADCQRILGLDLDGLDAVFQADVERFVEQAGPIEQRRLERLGLDPKVDAGEWKAFVAEYLAAARRLRAPYDAVRLDVAWSQTDPKASDQGGPSSYQDRLLRSGEFASLRHRWAGSEIAYLAHPRRSILAHRDSPEGPWQIEDETDRTPEQSRRRALRRIDGLDTPGRLAAVPLLAFARELENRGQNTCVVTALERFTESGRPRVRVRIEDRSQADWYFPWRAGTFVLAADDGYAVQSERAEGAGQEKSTFESELVYDRLEGVPVLRSQHTTSIAPDGSRKNMELKILERRFGPIPEDEFDPDGFLDGPQVTEAWTDPFALEPSPIRQYVWLPPAVGMVSLIAGGLLAFGLRRSRGRLASDAGSSIAPAAAIILLALVAAPPAARGERISFLDNGSIRIGVDLDIGGTITFLSRSKGGANLINSYDLGRQVQQSYYSGPQPFGKAHPGWKNWPWNPIGSGDVYKHPSRVIEHSNDGKTLYTKTIPMQWALNNVPGECTFETWITLKDRTANVRCRLTNSRPDRTQYPAHGQELPAVYTIGKLYRLFTYDGDQPFEGRPLRQIQNAGPPWADWKATESWAALVDDRGIGVGVIHPGVYSFTGGFHSKPNTGGPKDQPTGYIAPIRREILDHNIVYEYRYILAIGTLEDIQAVAAANRIKDTRPDAHFDHDRRHWIYHNARDAGFPIAGGLRIKTTGDHPQMIGPEQWWRAEDVPKLFIRAAFRTRGDRLEVFWSAPGVDFGAERRVALTIQPDGQLRTYEANLAATPTYRGTITGLRLDLPDASGPDDEIRIESISWRPE
jgi:hypothetical protein